MHTLFIHGFGGADTTPAFKQVGDAFIEKHNLDIKLSTFSWDSKKIIDLQSSIDPRAQFDAAQQSAKEEALRLETWVSELELANKNYLLVAHSLGCQLVLNFLSKTELKLKNCKGIFFLGAAVDSDYSFPLLSKFRRSKLKIINYYSSKYDIILKFAYNFHMSNKDKEVQAAGMSGFKDSKHFVNMRCAATHADKAQAFKGDWSNMAPVILEKALILKGEKIKGKSIPIPSINSGDDWWNNVFQFKHDKQNYVIQHHKVGLKIKDVGTELYRMQKLSSESSTILKKIPKLGKVLEIKDQLSSITDKITGTKYSTSLSSFLTEKNITAQSIQWQQFFYR